MVDCAVRPSHYEFIALSMGAKRGPTDFQSFSVERTQDFDGRTSRRWVELLIKGSRRAQCRLSSFHSSANYARNRSRSTGRIRVSLRGCS